MNPNLREWLGAADPAATVEPYDAQRRARFTALAMERGPRPQHSESLPEPGRIGIRAGRMPLAGVRRRTRAGGFSRIPRRLTLALVAATAVIGTTIMIVGSTVVAPAPALAAEMDDLALTALSNRPLGSNYLYTKTHELDLSMDGGAGDRTWRSSTIQRWQGASCDNDRMIEVVDPVRWPTREEERRWRAKPWADYQEELDGHSYDKRGRDLWALDHRSCNYMGHLDDPTPMYAATFPTTPDAFLAKLTREAQTPAVNAPHLDKRAQLQSMVLTALEIPWLTDAQRAAGLRAFGKVGYEWHVIGHATVAGIRGVVMRTDVDCGSYTELVIGASAPGILRYQNLIVDAVANDRCTRSEYPNLSMSRTRGLPDGTYSFKREVLAAGVVANLDTYP